MAKIEVVLPQMGEGIIEATITRWLAEINTKVEEDEPIVEIATDKVDSEIPTPISGTIVKYFFSEGEIPKVGDVIAIIDDGKDDGNIELKSPVYTDYSILEKKNNSRSKSEPEELDADLSEKEDSSSLFRITPFIRFFASSRNIYIDELTQINGSGEGDQITKKDVLEYIQEGRPFRFRNTDKIESRPNLIEEENNYQAKEGEEIIEIDRTRTLIAQHMVKSVQIAPHVTSFVEADITQLVNWRESIKKEFKDKYKVNITYTPIIVEAVVRAIKEFPAINSSLIDNHQQVIKKYINIGIATALPDGNLIVPVIRDADQLNLKKLTFEIAEKAARARQAKLNPTDTMGGTFTITNLGQFNNIFGTPIIYQPQSAILAVGAIKKKPGVVISQGVHSIGIRDIITLSLSYDHRIIDGALGGAFLNRIGELLENYKTQDIF